MTTKHRPSRITAALLPVLALAGLACVSENAPPTGTIEFTNNTDVRISVIRTNTEFGLQSRFDRAPHLTRSHEPGETWVDGNVGVEFDQDGRYCQPTMTYWFVTPVDQTFVADGRADADRLWSADDVIVVDRLDGPCWDKNDAYTITDRR